MSCEISPPQHLTMKILITVTVNLLVVASTVEGTSLGLEVARCRAHCLEVSQTASCWSACQEPCQEEQEQEGARVACHWLAKINRVERVTSRRSQEVWQLSQPLTVSGCEVTWGALEVSRNSFRSSRRKVDRRPGTVSVLLGLDRSGEWVEIHQSQARGLRLQPGLAAHLLLLRLLVVGEDGVLAREDVRLDREQCGYSHHLTPAVTASHSEGDLLARLSLSLGESVSESEYLIRYQELPLLSSVLGSLVVSSQQFDLTLVRDSSYVIQVEDTKTGEISPPLVIKTSLQDSITPTIILATVITLSVVILAALTVMLYRRSERLSRENHLELNNNQPVASISKIVLDPTVVSPLNLDYHNIC